MPQRNVAIFAAVIPSHINHIMFVKASDFQLLPILLELRLTSMFIVSAELIKTNPFDFYVRGRHVLVIIKFGET